MNNPRLLEGGVHCDERGVVRYVNQFKPGVADRFYVISPARTKELRGWVGHRRDWKWFFACSGEFVLYVARLADLEENGDVSPEKYCLGNAEAKVLEVPPGFATAILAKAVPGSLLVFSTGSIEAASDDMIRFPIGKFIFDSETV